MPAPAYPGAPMRQFGGVPMAPSSPSSGNAGISPPSYPGAGHASGSVAAQPPLNFPALHLHPLNDSFAPKQISLAPPGPGNRIKIGRQTNAKTVPNPSNGYFDSKVLSRMHAEVWSQDGKVYIKDVKSSNGTFINSERLSAEGVESDVFELHSEDLVEFGIDIVGDDNKTIIHHKVACRVFLVLTAEDAMSLRADFAALYRGGGHGGPMGGAGMGPGAEGGLRRGKSTMSFDHILSRLQSELQKSRETGAELGTLAGAIGEVGETLGGGLAPMQNPPYQHQVPPDPSEAAAASASAAQSATVAALQEQLASTQASLASHVEKMHALEGLLAEHETMRSEVGSMKAEMEKAKRDIDEMNLAALSAKSQSRAANGSSDEEQDFDDGASVASMDTVMAGDAGVRTIKNAGASGDESAADEDALRQLNHVGPLAPADEPPAEESASSGVPAAVAAALAAQNEALSTRLAALEAQLEEALAIGRNLQAEHAGATEAVRALEGRMASLEKEVSETSARAEGAAVRALEGRFVEWRSTLESAWGRERQAWDAERDELKRVVKAWDEANGWLENEAAKAASANESNGIASASSPSPGAAGKRRGSKSAKRRAARRHLNPALRALLYHSSHADAGPLDDDELSDADEAPLSAASGLGVSGADRAADSTSEAARSDSSAERTDSTAATSPSGSVAALAKSAVPPPLAGVAQPGSTRAMENASLPMMGAAGVVAIGMAAWIISGKAAPKFS